MADLKLRFACERYAHVRALFEGRVKPEGIVLEPASGPPSDIFPRAVRDQAFDVCELGLTFYVSLLAREDRPFVALPVFPSRSFRHSAVYVNANSGIAEPGDLAGKRLGETFCYGTDAAIWARGILGDEFGLPPENSTRWVVGGLDRPMPRWDWLPFGPPPHLDVTYAGTERTLDQLLEAGEIDALYSPYVPPCMRRGTTQVRRLFEDSEAVERAYYRRTHVFPIMHTVVIRRELYEREPWIAASLYAAFKAAKAEVDAHHRETGTFLHRVMMIPWLTEHYAENVALMGDDPWPYGLAANRGTLEAFLRYRYAQGLTPRPFAAEELFAPETLSD